MLNKRAIIIGGMVLALLVAGVGCFSSKAASTSAQQVVFNCTNDETSKCIDFGAANENPSNAQFSSTGDAQPIDDFFSSKTIDGGNDNRAMKSSARIAFDSFGALDENGFPKDDFILQVKYKDVYRKDGTGFKYAERVMVDTLMDYGSPKINFLEVGKLLGTGDNTWKYEQIYFPTSSSNFQRLRSANGKFTIKLLDQRPVAERIEVPIDHILIKKLTASESAAFAQWQKDQFTGSKTRLDYVETHQPPSFDGDYTWYSVASMEPIYPNQVPLQGEVKKTIEIASAYSQTEVFNFGIYTKKLLDGVSFAVHDLSLSGSSNTILPKENISVKKVVYADRLWSSASGTYGLMPDYPQDISSPVSINASRSQQFWGEVKITPNLPGGEYLGSIDILKNGQVDQTIPLKVRVVPIELTEPSYISTLYHDPTVTSNISGYGNPAAIKNDLLEHGINNVLGDLNINFKNTSTTNCADELDYSKFESNFNLLKDEGLLSDTAAYRMVPLYSNILKVCASGKQYWWERYREPQAMQKYEEALKKIKEIASKRNTQIVLIGEDEPDQSAQKHMQVMVTSTIAHKAGLKVWSTYSSEASRLRNCQEKISSNPDQYAYCSSCTDMATDFCQTNSSGVPQMEGLAKYVDYKAWAMGTINQDNRNDRGQSDFLSTFGYYTTGFLQMKNPVINRFLNSYYAANAEGVGAKIVANWAYVGEAGSDPYNEFDQNPRYGSARYKADYALSYPSWNGKMVANFAMKGLREGLKDARYIATLKKLIAANPNDPIAQQAQTFLNTILDSNHVKTKFFDDYVANRTDYGMQGVILKYLSGGAQATEANADDYEIFDVNRSKMINYIETIGQLSLVIKADKTTVYSGDVVTYTVELKNITSDTLSNVQVAAPIPTKTQYVSNSSTNNGSLSSGKIEWNTSIPAGATFAASFKVKIN